MHMMRPFEGLFEKAILPNEVDFGLTGLISNGLAGVQTNQAGSRMYVRSVVIPVLSPFFQTHYCIAVPSQTARG